MKQSDSKCLAQGLALADVCHFPFPGNSSELCPDKGKKHRAPSPTLEPSCQGSNPASTTPSPATSDEVSDLSAPQTPHPQKEDNNVLTLRTLVRMKVLKAGLVRRKLSGCVAAIITIITDPTSDIYIALYRLRQVFGYIISLDPGDRQGACGHCVTVTTMPSDSGDGCHLAPRVLCLVKSVLFP